MRRAALALLVTAALPIAGCGEVEEDDAIRYDDPRKTIKARVGEELEIALPSNPSTGYSWRFVQRPDPDVLEQTNAGFESSQGAGEGGAGKQVYSFEAKRPGKALLRLRYVGPDGREVAERRTIRVVVDPFAPVEN